MRREISNLQIDRRFVLMIPAVLLLAACGNPKPQQESKQAVQTRETPVKATPPPDTPPAPGAVSWTKSLGLKSLADIDTRLKTPWQQPFDVFVKDDKVTITNCADYLKVVRGKWSSTEPQEEEYILINGLDCHALDLLRNAKPATQDDPFKLTPDANTVLPPDLGVVASDDDVADVRKAGKLNKPWKAVAPGMNGKVDQSEPDTVVFTDDADGMMARLTEIARGDFTGSGTQEIIIRSVSGATQGTYAATHLYVLGRSDAKPVLVVKKRFPPE